MFDNRVFNVNGRGNGYMLDITVNLAFLQGWGENGTCDGWSQSKEHGLILHWSSDEYGIDVSKFPVPLSSDECMPMIKSWLNGDFAKTCFGTGNWDGDIDHDGHNELGWRVYCDDWGHVGQARYTICAIQPVYVWLGK